MMKMMPRVKWLLRMALGTTGCLQFDHKNNRVLSRTYICIISVVFFLCRVYKFGELEE
jgi:hypothetical protein